MRILLRRFAKLNTGKLLDPEKQLRDWIMILTPEELEHRLSKQECHVFQDLEPQSWVAIQSIFGLHFRYCELGALSSTKSHEIGTVSYILYILDQ